MFVAKTQIQLQKEMAQGRILVPNFNAAGIVPRPQSIPVPSRAIDPGKTPFSPRKRISTRISTSTRLSARLSAVLVSQGRISSGIKAPPRLSTPEENTNKKVENKATKKYPAPRRAAIKREARAVTHFESDEEESFLMRSESDSDRLSDEKPEKKEVLNSQKVTKALISSRDVPERDVHLDFFSTKSKGEREANKHAREEAKADRDAKTSPDREAKAEAEREEKTGAEREEKTGAEREEKTEAEREAKASADREAKAEAEREAKASADRKVKAEAEREAKASADREAEASADREAEAEADRVRGKAEREAKASADKKGDEEVARAESASSSTRVPVPYPSMARGKRREQKAERKGTPDHKRRRRPERIQNTANLEDGLFDTRRGVVATRPKEDAKPGEIVVIDGKRYKCVTYMRPKKRGKTNTRKDYSQYSEIQKRIEEAKFASDFEKLQKYNRHLVIPKIYPGVDLGKLGEIYQEYRKAPRILEAGNFYKKTYGGMWSFFSTVSSLFGTSKPLTRYFESMKQKAGAYDYIFEAIGEQYVEGHKEANPWDALIKISLTGLAGGVLLLGADKMFSQPLIVGTVKRGIDFFLDSYVDIEPLRRGEAQTGTTNAVAGPVPAKREDEAKKPGGQREERSRRKKKPPKD